jgi:hypothetical protein
MISNTQHHQLQLTALLEMFVSESTKITFGLIASTATAHEMDACSGLDVQAPENGSCPPRQVVTSWWHWIYLEVNFEEVFDGAQLVNYADNQCKMEQGKARHIDVVEAAVRALLINLAEAVAKFCFFSLID